MKVLTDVRSPIMTEERVYIPLSCTGMLNRLSKAKGKYLRLVVDAKQGVVAGTWGVLTLGFVVCRQEVSSASFRVGRRRVCLQCQTSTMQPIMMAIIQAEDSPNLQYAFEDLCGLCKTHGDFDLPIALLQVQKDYALAIEKARTVVFPRSREVNDYPHLVRNVRTQLPKQLVKQTIVAADEHKGKKRGPKSVNKKYFKDVMEMLNSTRAVASLELFDALWKVFFYVLDRQGEGITVRYLQKTYFKLVKCTNLGKVFKRTTTGAWGEKEHVWFGGHWIGVLGTAPGSGSGSQTLEARHSQWERDLRSADKKSPASIFKALQTLFDRWNDIFDWRHPCSFSQYPKNLCDSVERRNPCSPG